MTQTLSCAVKTLFDMKVIRAIAKGCVFLLTVFFILDLGSGIASLTSLGTPVLSYKTQKGQELEYIGGAGFIVNVLANPKGQIKEVKRLGRGFWFVTKK